MPFSTYQNAIKRNKKDSPLWMICLVIIMVIVIAGFMALPFLVESYDEYDEYGPSIIVNSSTGTNHDEVFSPTGNDVGDEQEKKQGDGEGAAQEEVFNQTGSDVEEEQADKGTPQEEGFKQTGNDVEEEQEEKGATHDGGFNQTGSDVEEEQGEEDNMSVKTEKGWIRGVESGGVRVFHGVPYAKPPIGQLRWASPREMDSWSPKVYNATFKRNGCPQRCEWHEYCPPKTSEDCLFLEIYAPLNATPPSRVPVMVYLHGGSFSEMSATSQIYDSTYLVKRLDVLVVLVEYRLGALGFMVHTNDDNDILGNFGLLDQALALEWVQKNIQAFGGDPNKVTLAGQSAGAQSSLIHLQSSETSQKFRSLVLESIPFSFPLKTLKEGLDQSQEFVQLTGCTEGPSNTSFDLDCLRNLDTGVILDAQSKIHSIGSGYLSKAQPWGPVIDNKTLFTQLLDSFGREETYTKPILCGITREEALLFVKWWFKQPTGLMIYNLAVSILVKGSDAHRIKSLYPFKSQDSRDEISTMMTDFVFRCPLQWGARKLSSKGFDTMWNYVWDKTLKFAKSDYKSMCTYRSCHGLEIPFVFHNFDTLNASYEDRGMSDKIIDYYGNFIKNGNPNEREETKSSDVSLPHWPKAFNSAGQYQILAFDKNGTVASESGVREDRCRLWIDKKFTLRR